MLGGNISIIMIFVSLKTYDSFLQHTSKNYICKIHGKNNFILTFKVKPHAWTTAGK